jgi:hypothetical protein
MVILSGIVLVGWTGSTSGFRRDTFELVLDIAGPTGQFGPPPSPFEWSWDVDQWTPFATINAIAATGSANNAGFAVDSVGFRDPATLVFDVAVRSSTAELFRVGYQLTLIVRPKPVARL